MINAATIPAERLRFTTRLIRDQALERGWKVWLYYEYSSQLRLERPDGTQLEVYSATPPTTSYVAALRADDKFFTHVALQAAGLPLPETYVVGSLAQATPIVQQFVAAGKQYVIKPLNEGHGNGVSVELETLDHLPLAFAYAQEYSEDVIIQEQVQQPTDLRIMCINGKCVAGLVRIPARVLGDGTHTVAELIETENHSSRRGLNYTKELNIINKTRAELYVGNKLKYVPKKGEWFQVLGTANVGTGGETVDVTHELPQWLKDMAVKAAEVMELPVCGVDFLLGEMPKITHTPQTLPVKIIEINKTPALFMHETPTYGKPRPVVSAYLDYLGTL